MLIFWVTGPHAGRIVTQWRYWKQSKDWRGKPTLNPYFYGPKYRSSDALPAPEIISFSFNFFIVISVYFETPCSINARRL